LRRDNFSATKASLPFSKPQKAIFPNSNAASVAETEIDAAKIPAHTAAPVNQLYYGDNLLVFREHIADES
jgi:hypothetical protein